jgi:hypothetical protein
MNAHATVSEPMDDDFDAEHFTTRLILLKDKIKVLDDEHELRLKPYKEARDKLEKRLLGYLLKINAKNISTEHGTISQLHRKSASLEDPQAFMTYVINNEAWDLLDRKANTKAVEDFINSNNSPPPGVKFNDALTLGLRRK